MLTVWVQGVSIGEVDIKEVNFPLRHILQSSVSHLVATPKKFMSFSDGVEINKVKTIGKKIWFISKLVHVIPLPHIVVAHATSLKQTAMDRNRKIKTSDTAYNQSRL